ncbi:unnamed protein product [Cunninghamella blakesleeana]
MEGLPNELTTLVFQQLPQKLRHCKEWQNLFSQPIFYKTLHIYSYTQLNKCIDIANTDPKTDQHFSYHVETIYFHTDFDITNENLVSILCLFPNLTRIQGLSKRQQPLPTKIPFPPLNKLKYIHYWYQYHIKKWTDALINNHRNIKMLEFTKQCDLPVSKEGFNEPPRVPTVYFALVSTMLPIYGGILNVHQKSESTVYTVNLPIMSCLTYLSINCKYRIGNENMFESIHQSCPQLKSLILDSFTMYISNDYNDKISQRLLEPNITLKELRLSEEMNDPKCYDYLSFKYPHLEPLSLSLCAPNYPDSLTILFNLSIYEMITQYNHLKKLIVRFTSKIKRYKFWPHYLLLEWLRQNPTKLYYLDYPFNFKISHFMEDKNDDEFKQSIVQPIYENLGIQEQDYLNHLSFLSLGNKSVNGINALFYFYICNEKNYIISNSVEELVLEFTNLGNIFYWLNRFPNLKSLSIFGNNGTKVTDEYNQYSGCVTYKDIIEQVNMNMEQQQQQNKKKILLDSELESSSPESENKFYKLRKIEIQNCRVNFERYGWNGDFKQLPNLKKIILSKINPVQRLQKNSAQYTSGYYDLTPNEVTFDFSHLSLDLLKINQFNDNTYNVFKENRKVHCVRQLLIYETAYDKEYYLASQNIVGYSRVSRSNSTT